MFNTTTWSTRKLSWFYALVIALLVAFASFLLIHFKIIEIFDVRIVYVVFILLGILGFSTDLARRSKERISFMGAFKHCFRTGAFMCAILFSIVIVVVLAAPNINVMEQGGMVSRESDQIGFCFSMVIEIFATILMSSFVAAFIPGITQKRK